MDAMVIIDVTPENAAEEGFFCIANPAHPGSASKRAWFKRRYSEGLRVKNLRDASGERIAFIEYVPAEHAWRPVRAPGYLFIHCISGRRKKDRGRGYASMLIAACEDDARTRSKSGVAVMTSDGPWMASMQVFLKNGYSVVDRRGRFELLAKRFNETADTPRLLDPAVRVNTDGWRLMYADQCPWHERAARELAQEAAEHGIDLTVTRITSPEEAQQAPSDFGVFSLVCDGEVIEDHYISRTRFSNILRDRKHGPNAVDGSE